MMKVIQQNERFDVKNIDNLTVENERAGDGKHGHLLPNTIRCIISGPSNCGKTNVLFNLITQPNGLKFNNVYIFSKSLFQPKYQLLEKIITDVDEVNLFKFDSSDSVIPPDHALPYSIFVFDDVSTENQEVIRSYFSMGRHKNIDSIYIGQTYSKVPKQLIRDNVNLLVIFKQDDTNLKHIYREHVGCDMTYDQMREICAQAWKDKYGFLVISKENDKNNGRYRIKFDKFIHIP